MGIKNLNELAKFVKGGADVLQKAIDSEEETSLEFIEGSFVSDTDLETLKTGQFDAGKKEGNTIGYDFALKDLKKDFGIEMDGKDRKVIVGAIKKKITDDAGIEPDKKVKELSESLANLQNTYNTDTAAKDLEIQNLNRTITKTKINGDLFGFTPEGLTGIKTKQFAALAQMEYKFEYDESGQMVVKKGDSILKDKMEKPLSVKEVLTDFATQNEWIGASGRGGGHSGGGGSSDFKTEHDVYKHMETNKINPMSPEGEKLLTDFKNS